MLHRAEPAWSQSPRTRPAPPALVGTPVTHSGHSRHLSARDQQSLAPCGLPGRLAPQTAASQPSSCSRRSCGAWWTALRAGEYRLDPLICRHAGWIRRRGSCPGRLPLCGRVAAEVSLGGSCRWARPSDIVSVRAPQPGRSGRITCHPCGAGRPRSTCGCRAVGCRARPRAGARRRSPAAGPSRRRIPGRAGRRGC